MMSVLGAVLLFIGGYFFGRYVQRFDDTYGLDPREW